MNPMQLQNKMDTIFMNSKDKKTSNPRRLLINLPHKTNLRRDKNMLLYQILISTFHGKL